MRVEPLIYNFEYQKKGNTRKSIKGRFAQSDAVKKHWSTYDNIASYEGDCYVTDSKVYNKKPTRNSILGFRKLTNALSKINTTHETVDTKDYVMPIYRNGFIGVESFIPRNSNRQKYRLIIPTYVSRVWPKVNGVQNKLDKKNNIPRISRARKEREKIFDSKYSAEKHARTLEQEHIEHVKQQYEEYFKTNKYT